uniref:Secreted protein n=1 Tax=Globodera pallida TaxID=36090 RepID=A0A183C554_GLOPA
MPTFLFLTAISLLVTASVLLETGQKNSFQIKNLAQYFIAFQIIQFWQSSINPSAKSRLFDGGDKAFAAGNVRVHSLVADR